MLEKAVQFSDVVYSIESRKEYIPILNSVSFGFPAVGVSAIVGPSGSGKTTILDLIAGIVSPTSGVILVNGVNVTQLNQKELAAHRRKMIGYVFQQFRLIPSITALQNVALPMELAGKTVKESRARARELLDRVGLGHRATMKAGRLSGGEQQRVAVARAISLEPGILLADEPTGSLDEELRDEIMQLLVEVSMGRSLILVTHDESVSRYAEVVYEMPRLNEFKVT